MKLPEIAWGWPEIAVILAWKIAPLGYVLRRESMFSLPTDRVLREHRQPDKLTLGFISVLQARRQIAPELGEKRATLSELQGRWQKIAVVSLWQFAKEGRLGKRDEVVLTEYDRQAVPSNLRMLAAGHGQGVEFNFMARELAEAQREREIENEGVNILEKVDI